MSRRSRTRRVSPISSAVAISIVLSCLAVAFFALSASLKTETNRFTLLAGALVGAALSVITYSFVEKRNAVRSKTSEFAIASEFTFSRVLEKGGELSKTLNPSQAYQISLAFCDLLLSRALAVTPKADRCALWIPEKQGHGLELYFSKARIPSLATSYSRRLTETSTAASALLQGQSIRIEKSSAELQKQRPKSGYRYTSYVCVPLLDGAERVAVITIDSGRAPTFQRDDQIRLEKLTRVAARPLRQLLARAKPGVEFQQLVSL